MLDCPFKINVSSIERIVPQRCQPAYSNHGKLLGVDGQGCLFGQGLTFTGQRQTAIVDLPKN